VIESFKNKGTQNIFEGISSKSARKICPQSLWKVASRKLDLLDSAVCLDDLKVPPGNRLEALKGDRQGQFSIRINEQYRICFIWSESNVASDVEIVDYHS
jgi:proteic killer suppression protein